MSKKQKQKQKTKKKQLKKLASGKLSGGVVVVDSFDGGVVVGAGNLVQVCCLMWRALSWLILIFFFAFLFFSCGALMNEKKKVSFPIIFHWFVIFPLCLFPFPQKKNYK